MELSKEEIRLVRDALEPLKLIADAYDKNELDDEARRFYGRDHTLENSTNPEMIELYAGRGGKRLLTLQDCFDARVAWVALGIWY